MTDQERWNITEKIGTDITALVSDHVKIAGVYSTVGFLIHLQHLIFAESIGSEPKRLHQEPEQSKIIGNIN